MGCTDSKSRYFEEAMRTSFPKYYRYIYKKLQSQKFKFIGTFDDISLKKKLCIQYGISHEVAKVWISMYIDYMIYAGWNLLSGTDMIIYPPYALQQVLRVHTCDLSSYESFCSIVSESKGVIPYYPNRIISKQDPDEYNAIRESYKVTRYFLKQNIYSNPEFYTTFERIDQAHQIWETFEMTVIQCELSFCFHSQTAKESFEKLLIDNAGEIAMEDQKPEQILDAAEKLRAILGIDKLIPLTQETYKPSVRILTQKSISPRLCSLSFSAEFVNTLAWEQRISVEEAKRIIEEYKKFLFIVFLTEDETLAPSQLVDQVWRLHMQFVETYQRDTQIVKPIHYCPAKDDMNGKQKLRGSYEKTLKAYRAYFGTPLKTIWPPVENRALVTGRLASYYLAFTKGCLSEEQTKDVIQKYKEHTRKKSKSSKGDANQEQLNRQTKTLINELPMLPILFQDPFDDDNSFVDCKDSDLAHDFMELKNARAKTSLISDDVDEWWGSQPDINEYKGSMFAFLDADD